MSSHSNSGAIIQMSARPTWPRVRANPSLPSVPCHPVQARGDFRPVVAASSLDRTFRGRLRQVSAGWFYPPPIFTPGVGIAVGELRVT